MLLALLCGGCEAWQARRDFILPTQLSLLVEDAEGRPLSVVLDLRRNTRNQLDVRVSEGWRLFDGKHLWHLETRPSGAGYSVHLSDELGREQERTLPVTSTSEPRILALDRMEVWLQASDGMVHCSLRENQCERAAESGKSPLDHVGPGRGFHVELGPTGDLVLILPLDGEGQPGQTILTDVKRVVGAHWVHEGFLERDPVLDRTFRGRASLVAVPRAVTLDGDLGEWLSAEPLVVESPWQIETGADHWQGPLDASFSVTASRTEDGVCFAGRVRDDDITPADQVRLSVGDVTLDLPLHPSASQGTSAQVRHEAFGTRFEACARAELTRAGRLPFAAALTDVDDQQPETVLASAPVQAAGGAGQLKVVP